MGQVLRGWHRGRPRDIEESIWRRTQHPLNAAQSGWDGTGGRRRIVHYRNRYTVAGGHLVLAGWYLYCCLTCPSTEARSYATQIAEWATAGGWASDGGQSWRLGDLRACLTRHTAHPEDTAAGRGTPTGFEPVEMTFSSDGLELPPGTARLLAADKEVRLRRVTSGRQRSSSTDSHRSEWLLSAGCCLPAVR